MNVLETEKRAQILNCLVEGCSMRATSRLTGAAKKTVERLLVSAGDACQEYQDRIFRNLNCQRLQLDEVWSFTYAKQKNVPQHLQDCNEVGDTWTWIAIDAETKLIPCWHVGKRTADDAMLFVNNLAKRLASRVQLTTDGLCAYVDAVHDAFGNNIDYARLVKLYGHAYEEQKRFSTPICIGARKTRAIGRPDPAHISTSYIERQNLTLRMSNRRFTRLTNAFSKKLENHKRMMAISMMNYNFCRIHQTLRITPAMQAGLTQHIWDIGEVVKELKI